MIRVLMDFYEKNLNGVYVEDPHSYEFNLGAGHENLSKIHDIICQAAEIDGLTEGDYLLTVTCQEGDTVLGITDFFLHIDHVERTRVPSKYIRSTGGAPAVMSIHRYTFQYTLRMVPPFEEEDEVETETHLFD